MAKENQFQYITYGSKANSREVEQLLHHLLDAAREPSAKGYIPTPVCIWGMHGIGKTAVVKDVAIKRGYHFTYIAPAQFEEMGDLVGMPKIETNADGDVVTRLVPPSWVPNEEGGGIFLIDDVNRADDRILRGIMQLLQNYELVSWKMPPGWLIVLTANPDGGDYSVTTMDDAMLTRMIHVTMDFDVKSWGRWAEEQQIDPRGIDFVLTYPEIISGHRTTPRSLVQFFEAIAPIKDLKESIVLVKMLGDGCLDPETVISFINFINMDLNRLISPEEILNAASFETIAQRTTALVETETKRLDILSVIMTRLTNHLILSREELSDKQFENLKKFLLQEIIPNDLRLAMAQEIVQSDKKSIKKLYAVPEIGKLLLTKM